jgi:hypothetical protein
MPGTIRQPDRNSWAVPHAGFYQAMVLLVMAFVLAAWGFSADPGYIRLALGVVTGSGVMAVALSSVMAQIWRHGRNDRQSAKAKTPASFYEWARGQFGSSEGDVSAQVAAVEILLPIAAAVVGLTAFAIVWGLVAS